MESILDLNINNYILPECIINLNVLDFVMINSPSLFSSQLKLTAVIALSFFMVGCNQANSEPQKNIIKPVKLITVPDLSSQHTDNFLAKIGATERAELSFQVAGEIESVPVRMGEIVEKGQVLAQLDPTDYQIALDAKQAQFDLAKTRFDRAEKLYRKKLISTDSFDQTETSYQAALVSLEQAKTDLSYTTISAPFDGVVSLDFSKAHELVAPKQVVLNLINNVKMDVTFSIPVKYVEKNGLSAIKKTQLFVRMDSHLTHLIPANFKEISTQADQDTNSYTAVVSITKPEGINLLSGMTGQVQVVNSERSSGFKIMDSAWITKTSDKGTLWLFDSESKQVEKTQVMLDDEGYVLDGLKQGDLIVVAGVSDISEGQQVKVWQREGGI